MLDEMKMIRIIFLYSFYISWLCFLSDVLADPPGPQETDRSPSFEIPQAPLEAKKSAEKGKQRLERLAVTDKYARELGFDSKSQAADSKTTLGAPFPVIIVNFTTLKTYASNIPPDTLLILTKRFIYPVLVSGEVRSSVTVSKLAKKDAQEWKAIEWGARGLIGLLHKSRIAAGSDATSFVLWIPQLSRYFLGNIEKEKFSIIPLYDEKDYGFTAGVPKAAIEVFKFIAAEAKQLPVSKARQPSSKTLHTSPTN